MDEEWKLESGGPDWPDPPYGMYRYILGAVSLDGKEWRSIRDFIPWKELIKKEHGKIYAYPSGKKYRFVVEKNTSHPLNK